MVCKHYNMVSMICKGWGIDSIAIGFGVCRNVRAGAADQLFYMVACCMQNPAPLTSQLALLVETIEVRCFYL